MLPQPSPEHPAPVADHVTTRLAVPLTLAANCCWAPGARFIDFGDTLTMTSVDSDTDEEADLVASATDVAFTVTSETGGTVGGAVYNPVLETVPQAAPAQPTPLTLQFTLVFADPVTVAWNCCWPPVFIEALVGEIVIPTAAPEEPRVTVAVADFGGFESRVAVTVAVGGFGATAGAVYKPLALMLPQVIPLQPLPETLHSTTPLVLPVTVAEN